MFKRITAVAFALVAAGLMSGAQTNYWIPDIEFVSPVANSCANQDYVDVNIKFNVGIRPESVKVWMNGCRVESALRVTTKGLTGRLERRHCLNICDKACSECHRTNTLRVRGKQWVGNERELGTTFFYLGSLVRKGS